MRPEIAGAHGRAHQEDSHQEKPHTVSRPAKRLSYRFLLAGSKPSCGRPHHEALDRRFDPQWNIERGTAHLARDLHRFRRRYPTASNEDLLRMTLAAYFAGPGRVGFRQGAPVLPSYTRAYVDDAMAVWRRLRAGKPGR